MKYSIDKEALRLIIALVFWAIVVGANIYIAVHFITKSW